MMASKQTIAFFGATGGCAGSSLACALRSGYHCTALARTPSKLVKCLTIDHDIPASVIETNLTIIQGDAKTASDVAQALISPTNSSHVVDIIYSSIGAYPNFKLSLTTPFVLPDPTLCTSGMRAVFSALSTLGMPTSSGRKPLLIALSSTGVNGKARDIPLLYYPLYKLLAAQPHADKRGMEEVVLGDKGEHMRDFVIVRPTALVDGAKGVEKVRSGWEWGIQDEKRRVEKEAGPAIGWTVGRTDVGAWIFKNVVEAGGWEGRCVSLTY
ncbi:uncharacterized protein CC84DRAFT_1164509 [Paraphaeosphaeria sporulosa]|uniref:NAD(P)-binding domain-containing protein n=1 Tax=Paraphaeosphaeria sporulosa TaxID=1460663 RepID=A0A177CHB7_9PLEO|nr:uncharacterized protein CC84DRAFT_1164509 [Paraphaeosphaeria sporulosa]OAG06180.1 hypothetical protein CC84DRAFT_1164509 [Paraphaeosphaeria sporulosa]